MPHVKEVIAQPAVSAGKTLTLIREVERFCAGGASPACGEVIINMGELGMNCGLAAWTVCALILRRCAGS